MVDAEHQNGKISDTVRSFTLVVAGALYASDGQWLMHRRPLEKHHGGLWEFPGGKVEPFEIPVNSLRRELHEELGITIAASACTPVGFAESKGKAGENPIVILLYKINEWTGEPECLEGGGIGWFAPEEIANLAKPPLDVILARQLFREP